VQKVSGILKNFYSPLSRHLQRSISFGYHVWAPTDRSSGEVRGEVFLLGLRVSRDI
jgi:hypothetical protein